MPNSLHVGHSKEHFTIFNRMETANKQRSGCANYTSEKVYYFFFFPLTLRVTFESLKYTERSTGGSSIEREDATFNNCLSNNFHCHLFPCQKKETIHIQENSTAKWLCLTLLQSETPGNIHLSTLYKYLSWKGGPGRGHL